MIIRLKHISDVPTLHTSRLKLIPLSKSFLSKKYVNWMNDKDVSRYLQSGGNYSIEKLSVYLNEVELKPKYFWAITVKTNGVHIGNIKIDPIHFKNKYGEYGVMLGDKNFWGKGFAREASKEVLRFCFQDLGLRKINLGVISINEDAISLYKDLGFKIEGHFKKHIEFEGKFIDTYRMSIFNLNFK